MTGDELKSKRDATGLTQFEFAAELEIHVITLSRFERGAQPVPRVVELAVAELARQLRERARQPVKIRKPGLPRKLASKKKTK